MYRNVFFTNFIFNLLICIRLFVVYGTGRRTKKCIFDIILYCRYIGMGISY